MRLGQLFSEYFLREGITTTAAYKQLSADDARLDDLRRRLGRVYAAFAVAGSPNEAQTEQDLIFPVLDALGWGPDARLVQPRAARKGRADVPDMLLFPDAEAKRRASAEREDRRFWHGVAVVENKRWDRPLDRPTKDARQGDDEREVPSTQMLR